MDANGNVLAWNGYVADGLRMRGWRRVATVNTRGSTNGWRLFDENGVERVRFMRPEDISAKITWLRQRYGYWRWKNAAGDFLDENGMVVPESDVNFQELTHIIYSGPR